MYPIQVYVLMSHTKSLMQLCFARKLSICRTIHYNVPYSNLVKENYNVQNTSLCNINSTIKEMFTKLEIKFSYNSLLTEDMQGLFKYHMFKAHRIQFSILPFCILQQRNTLYTINTNAS